MIGRTILALLLLHLTACTTVQAVAVPDGSTMTHPVKVGDKVELTLIDGSEHEFKVTEVSADGLGGQPGFFLWSSVAKLHIRDNSGITKAVAGVLLFGLLIGGAVASSTATMLDY